MAPDPTPPPGIVCSGLGKTFDNGVQAVEPLDLTLAAGQATALVGPSGCGKSTLLRMIAGLEQPSCGSLTIGGRPPADTLRAAGLSVAFQDPSLLPWRSVRGNIELALGLARRPATGAEIDRLIELVGLAGFADARPAALSGGMRQRAAIARALATQPGLLLLDEPFGAVDELTRRQLAQDLPRLWETRGTTTVLVTHSVGEAVALSDRVVVLSPRPARIVADIAIPLPRPRTHAIAQSAEASALVGQVLSALSDGMGQAQGNWAAQ